MQVSRRYQRQPLCSMLYGKVGPRCRRRNRGVASHDKTDETVYAGLLSRCEQSYVAEDGGAGMNPYNLSITILLLFLYVMMYEGEVQE